MPTDGNPPEITVVAALSAVSRPDIASAVTHACTPSVSRCRRTRRRPTTPESLRARARSPRLPGAPLPRSRLWPVCPGARRSAMKPLVLLAVSPRFGAISASAIVHRRRPRALVPSVHPSAIRARRAAKGMGVERNLSEVRRHFSNWAAVHRDVEDVLRFESWWEIGPRCEAFREIGKGAALLRRRLFRLFIGVFARGRSLFGSFCAGPARPESRCPDASVVPSAPLDIRAAFWYSALGREMPLRWP